MNTCGRCGRRFDRPEATINGTPYCHPAESTGRTCYMEQSYEMTFDGTYPTFKPER